MKLGKKVYTILCDNIRQEIGNKISLMGIYASDIVFNELPASLPILSLAIFIEGLQVEVAKAKVQVILPKVDKMEFPLPQMVNQTLGGKATLVFSLSPFTAVAEGDAKIQVLFGEDKRPSIVHKFKISKAKK